jgi:hypothetical protein
MFRVETVVQQIMAERKGAVSEANIVINLLKENGK